MKARIASCCLLAIALCISSSAIAQTSDSKPTADAKPAAQPAAQPTPMPPATIESVVDKQISGLEKEFVSAAEAMPAEKYNFAPTNGEFKGVRTFGQQVKHVAVANTIMWSAAAGEKPTIDPSQENGPDSMTSKDDIVKFLKDSFALGHRAAKTLTTENFLERPESPWGKAPRVFWATFAVSHAFDHYGQMVEYLRMNGIIPPASVPEKK
jgi:uncharacterized damage-inducible protein DinB